MMQIFIPIFDQISKEFKELDEDEEMVTPAQVGGMFVDWTDPQKAV
jgi:condensin complex subunit 3